MNEFKQLPYNYDALEPYFDEQTMKIHHSKHYKGYYDKFIKAIKNTELKDKDVREILSNLNLIPSEIKTVVINNGGGFFHHDFLWPILKKDVVFKGEIADAIKNKWVDFEIFKNKFGESASLLFGSGWTWLVLNKNKELTIINTYNQDSPLSLGYEPLFGLDIWEHAYYLKYQNRRNEYIENFFKLINWDKVNEIFVTKIK